MKSFDYGIITLKNEILRACLKHLIQWSGICLCTISLSGCFMDGTSERSYFSQPMPYDDRNNSLYPETYDSSFDTYDTYRVNEPPMPSPHEVVVPQSYHMGATNSPPTAKDEDKQWVASQNPNGYTIQIKQDDKPASVARSLQQMPKNERSVEVRSQSGSYLGLHGSYTNQEEATAQLNNLPSSVKDQAQIKNWESIQKEVE